MTPPRSPRTPTGTTMLTTRIPDTLKADLDRVARAERVSLSTLVRRALWRLTRPKQICNTNRPTP